MLRMFIMAGATLLFVGAFAGTGSAAMVDASAAPKAAVVTLGTRPDTQPLVISVETGTSKPHPQPRRPRRTTGRTRGPK